MAKKVTNPEPAAPETADTAKNKNPLLVVLTVLLILVGIIDLALWGVVGYYAFQSAQQSAPSNGTQTDGGAPASVETPAGDGEDSDDDGKREALIAYIQDLAELESLETEMLESFASVSGENYTDDEAMYTEITERTLPLCQQMNEKVSEIVPGDSEIEELCNMHQDYVARWLNALTMTVSALSSQDAAQAAEANNQMRAADDLATEFHQALRSLAEERNVSLDG